MAEPPRHGHAAVQRHRGLDPAAAANSGTRYAGLLADTGASCASRARQHGGHEVDTRATPSSSPSPRPASGRGGGRRAAGAERTPGPTGASPRADGPAHRRAALDGDGLRRARRAPRRARSRPRRTAARWSLSEARRATLLAGGVSLRDLGEHRLKDLSAPRAPLPARDRRARGRVPAAEDARRGRRTCPCQLTASSAASASSARPASCSRDDALADADRPRRDRQDPARAAGRGRRWSSSSRRRLLRRRSPPSRDPELVAPAIAQALGLASSRRAAARRRGPRVPARQARCCWCSTTSSRCSAAAPVVAELLARVPGPEGAGRRAATPLRPRAASASYAGRRRSTLHDAVRAASSSARARSTPSFALTGRERGRRRRDLRAARRPAARDRARGRARCGC